MTEIPHPLTVIKVGTGVLTRVEDGHLDEPVLVRLVTAIAKLVNEGHRCLLVSSGAVGAGVSALGLDSYPEDLATKQACAATGQARLIGMYSGLFRYFDIETAQVLVTAYDLETEKRRERLMGMIARLAMEKNMLPILNENDSVAVRELRVGDNDVLSARVAKMLGARRLILLTAVDGLLNPKDQSLVKVVPDIDAVKELVVGTKGKFSIGGMASKLEAVRHARDAGIETIIAHGEHPERLSEIVEGGGICTRFPV